MPLGAGPGEKGWRNVKSDLMEDTVRLSLSSWRMLVASGPNPGEKSK